MRGHKNLCTFRILLRWFCYNQLTIRRPQYAVRILLLQPAGWLAGLQKKQLTDQATEQVQAVNRRLLTTKLRQSLGHPQYKGWSGLPENPVH